MNADTKRQHQKRPAIGQLIMSISSLKFLKNYLQSQPEILYHDLQLHEGIKLVIAQML